MMQTIRSKDRIWDSVEVPPADWRQGDPTVGIGVNGVTIGAPINGQKYMGNYNPYK